MLLIDCCWGVGNLKQTSREITDKPVTAAIPRHTTGSVMFLDRSQKLMFTGDDVNPKLWLQGNGATTLEWKIDAQIVLDYMQQDYTAWIEQLDGRQTYEQLSVIFGMVQEIIYKKKGGS